MGVSCKICNNKMTKKIGRHTKLSKDGFDVYKCLKCDADFVSPSPTLKQLDELYSNYSFDDELKNIYYIYRKAMLWISKLHSKIFAFDRFSYVNSFYKGVGNVLEVGVGEGELLNEFKKRHWFTNGVELSQRFIEKVKKKYDITIYNNISFYKDKKFDLIVMSHVLEHMINPINELKNLKNYLSQHGLIFIEVPHSPRDLTWWFPNNILKPIEFADSHLFHFTPKSLKIVAKKAGLNVFFLERVYKKQLFLNANLYDIFPERKKPFTSVIKGFLNAIYTTALYLFSKRVTATIKNWEKIDYIDYSDSIRIILTK